MACQECSAFNPNEQYFANCGADGKIKIWDTGTGSLKHEYTPNLHLSSPCSCIHWISLTSPQTTPKSKKRRTSLSQEYNALAIGLSSGKLVIFSLSTGTIVSDLSTDETVGNAITALTYEPENGEIITCTQDNKIYTWAIGSKNIKYKSHWKCAAPQNITSILVANKGEWLLCGHLSISLWERSNMELLKTFTGHASEISQMILLKSAGPDDRSYFISSAKGDRFLSVWSLAEGSRSKSAIASLKLEDAPKNTSVHIQGNNEPVSVTSITSNGHLHVFRHQLNGKISKPIKPKLTIQIKNEAGVNANKIPLIAAKICNLKMESVMVAYGSMHLVNFENISLDTHEKALILYRKVDSKPKPITDESITKIKEPEVSDKVEYLQSSSCTQSKSPRGLKRGNLDSAISVLGMEGRIDNLTLEDNIKNETPKGDSLAELLIQGLQSKDRRILQVVFSKNDKNLIESTISRLPVQCILPLIRELVSLSDGRTHAALIAVQWLRSVILLHSSYLMSDSELLSELFSPLMKKIETRLKLVAPLSRLRGRLDLVVGQITHNSNRDDSGLNPFAKQALIDFQDEDEFDDYMLLEVEDEDQMNISDSDDEELVEKVNEEASDIEENDIVKENDIEDLDETEEMEILDDDMSEKSY